MNNYFKTHPLPAFSLWEKAKKSHMLLSFDLELTERCNLDCRHCYINQPAGSPQAKVVELPLSEIMRIADEGVSLGALWCLITGGEPLLRRDFPDVYMGLKSKGLLVSVFTNATLIQDEHIRLFKAYPPRDLEVTVYGVTTETYEAVTRKPGSFRAFQRGLDLLQSAGIPVRLKTMALKSNLHEMDAISRFCQKRTKDYYRFDPFLHLRFDGDPLRNQDVIAERLSPEEVVELERRYPDRLKQLERTCSEPISEKALMNENGYLFYCGAGRNQCVIGHNGLFRACSSLFHPEFNFDLMKIPLRTAWETVLEKIQSQKSDNKDFLDNCARCSLVDLCMWCPAHAYLECGKFEERVDSFCRTAHLRVESVISLDSKNNN